MKFYSRHLDEKIRKSNDFMSPIVKAMTALNIISVQSTLRTTLFHHRKYYSVIIRSLLSIIPNRLRSLPIQFSNTVLFLHSFSKRAICTYYIAINRKTQIFRHSAPNLFHSHSHTNILRILIQSHRHIHPFRHIILLHILGS